MSKVSIPHRFYADGSVRNYWEGIIAPRDTWPRTDEGVASASQLTNYGYRVKVRIQGDHPANEAELTDDQLPEVIITQSSAGSGHKKTGLSIGVTQGSRIWGTYIDPAKKEGLIYMGTLANNEMLLLPKTQPTNNKHSPYSGYTNWDKVGTHSIPFTAGKPLEGLNFPNIFSMSDKIMMMEPAFPLSSPTECEKAPLSALSKSMKELISKVERAQAQLDTWEDAAQEWISNKQEWIQEKISEASEFVSLGLKDLFKEIRKFVEEEINKQTKMLIEFVNPPDRDKAKQAKDTIIELIVCLFNKMIGNLKGLVGNFLSSMLDRYINVPACAIQNFVGSLLGNVLGALSGAIDSIISNLSALIGGAFSIAGAILGILGQIAGFLSCEENQECPDTKEWSIFDGGAAPMTFDIDSIINQAKAFAANASNLVDIENITSIDFNDLINSATNAANACNVGPVFCGPPKVTFWGGGGSGAQGNAIISAAGDLLGIDLVANGLGYKKAPSIDIKDNCGKGGGVRAKAIMDRDGGIDPQTGDPTYKVVSVVIQDSGAGFLTRPNGDLGGDGRVWAPSDWTVVKREDGRWEKFPPGRDSDEDILPREGDTVIRPEDKTIFEGGIPLPIIGPGGQITPGVNPDSGISEETNAERLARLRGTTLIPGTGLNGATEFDSFPSLDIGSYPTILYLCDIFIQNHGINYEDGDEIVIEPSNGTEVVPKFGPFGVLDSIRIVKAGKGFVERPRIYVKSETGYNAILKPVFCVERIGDDTEGNLPDDQLLAGVVSVVNCVGITANEEFSGWINGKPYYGPTHTHRGVTMLGATHTSRPHPLVWQTLAESLNNYDDRFQWVNGTLLQVVQRTTSSSMPISSSQPPSPAPSPSPAPTPTPNNINYGTSTSTTPTPTPAPTPSPSSAPTPSTSPAPSPSPAPPSPPSPPPPSPPSGGGYYYP